MERIEKFTFGSGDRFAHRGEAQLSTIVQARSPGIDVCPPWNKSHREHTIIGSQPDDLRAEADAAVRALGYDADHSVDMVSRNVKRNPLERHIVPIFGRSTPRRPAAITLGEFSRKLSTP